jgi:hypothetical protein
MKVETTCQERLTELCGAGETSSLDPKEREQVRSISRKRVIFIQKDVNVLFVYN